MSYFPRFPEFAEEVEPVAVTGGRPDLRPRRGRGGRGGRDDPHFTLNLAKELGPRGITANAVAPGIIDTDVNAGWLRGNPAAEADAAARAALGRGGRPDDVADIVAFLASHDARWVTGKVIDATGGARL